jgi:hypothetical protein
VKVGIEQVSQKAIAKEWISKSGEVRERSSNGDEEARDKICSRYASRLNDDWDDMTLADVTNLGFN